MQITLTLELPVPPQFYKDREKRRIEAIKAAADASLKAQQVPIFFRGKKRNAESRPQK
jgi:hypothetical protein